MKTKNKKLLSHIILLSPILKWDSHHRSAPKETQVCWQQNEWMKNCNGLARTGGEGHDIYKPVTDGLISV